MSRSTQFRHNILSTGLFLLCKLRMFAPTTDVCLIVHSYNNCWFMEDGVERNQDTEIVPSSIFSDTEIRLSPKFS